MKKYIICAVIVTLILAGCAGNKKNDPDNTTAVSDTENVTASVALTTSPEEEDLIPLPPIPETGVPEISGGVVIYTDTEAVIVVAPEGSTYVNGVPIVGEFAEQILVQQQNKPENTTTTRIQYTPESMETGEYIEPIITIPDETIETLAPGTYFVDDSEDGSDDPIGNQGGTVIEDTVNLAKYVDTGDTSLNIKNIKVYSHDRPAVEGIDAFKPGDTAIVNLWCDAMSRFDAELYIVPMGAEHKDTYEKGEYVAKCELYTAFEESSDRITFEVPLPEGIPAHIYEFRFVCGTEEGYVPFHIG